MTHKIYKTAFSIVYPLYIKKVERKGRSKDEVDQIIMWQTGYTKKGLQDEIKKNTDFENFFNSAPKLNENRIKIKGVICGVRVEEITEPIMREIRYLDKLVDEIAKGKSLDKILNR